jgi:hypothetical protein
LILAFELGLGHHREQPGSKSQWAFGLLEEIQDIGFLCIERVFEAVGEIGDLGEIDCEEEHMRDIDID